MHRVDHFQMRVPIDAAAGIPARSWLFGVVAADGENVFLTVAEIQMISHVVAETDVAVGALAERVAIDPDFAVGHDAVELDADALGLVLGGKREMFAIPTDAPGQISTGAAGRGILIKRSFDAPIVRNIELSPSGVIEADGLGSFG